jgi:outer membrane protein OmpA-like peptidoglycan-associated protein
VTRAALLSLLIPSAAFAQDAAALRGYSTDIEMVRPSFGYRSIQGMATPGTNLQGTVRWGLVGQYARNPLTLYDFEEEVGAVISNRTSFAVGASVDASKQVSIGLVVPGAWNSGTHPNAAGFAADGVGLGDVGATVYVTALRLGMVRLGAHGGLILPTGRRAIYIGEQFVRGRAGLMAALDLGPMTFASDAGVTLRGNVDTQADFVLGPELDWTNAARVGLPVIPVAVTASVMTRGGFKNFLRGGAENSAEALGGLQVRPIKMMRIDVAAGRGFTQGYGTSDFRVLTGVIFEHVPSPPPPPPPPPPPVEVETVAVDEIPEPEVIEPEWEEGELAKIVGEEIKIREKLQFVVNTADLLPESKGLLEAIAGVVNTNALIGHVVIEGHASEEGSYDFNYMLSLNRAVTIFQELIKAGVHPSRLSVRGMGEVKPRVRGAAGPDGEIDESILAANRRVEFHIVRQHDPSGDELPTYGEAHRLPWTGESIHTVQPPPPEVPDPEGEGEGEEDDDFFDIDEDEGEEEE